MPLLNEGIHPFIAWALMTFKVFFKDTSKKFRIPATKKGNPGNTLEFIKSSVEMEGWGSE